MSGIRNIKDTKALVVGADVKIANFVGSRWTVYTAKVLRVTPSGQVVVQRPWLGESREMRFGADAKEIGASSPRWAYELWTDGAAQAEAEYQEVATRNEVARQKVAELGSTARHSSKADLIAALELVLETVRRDAR